MRTVEMFTDQGEFPPDHNRGEYVGTEYNVLIKSGKSNLLYSTAVVHYDDDDVDAGRFAWEEMSCEWTEDENGESLGDDEYEYGEGSYGYYDSQEDAEDAARAAADLMMKNHEKYLRFANEM